MIANSIRTMYAMNMNDNLLYKELLENPLFIHWAMSGNARDDEFWQDWKLQSMEHAEALEHARLTVRAIYGRKLTMDDEQVEARTNAILATAKSREGRGLSLRQIPLSWRSWAAAASVLMVMALGWVSYQNYRSTRPVADGTRPGRAVSDEQMVKVVNTGKQLRHIRLADGSSVVLYQNSAITYPGRFSADRRLVTLTGDAFFEVAKDSLRPFFVYSGGLVTRVVGTSFSIRSGAEGVRVAVKTGKVAVFPETADRPADGQAPREGTVLLMPQEQAVFEKASTRIVKAPKQATPLLNIPIETQPFDYDHTPIAQVFASIENAYGVKIHFDHKLMRDCSLSATLGDEPLETKLEWISSILEATYTIKDEDITISAKPCH